MQFESLQPHSSDKLEFSDLSLFFITASDFDLARIVERDTKEKGNSHELPKSIFVNLKSNTIMKKP